MDTSVGDIRSNCTSFRILNARSLLGFALLHLCCALLLALFGSDKLGAPRGSHLRCLNVVSPGRL